MDNDKDNFDGNWDDDKKLELFGSKVDVITSEFENIPAKTLDNLSKITKVYPSSFCFSIAQHRNKEKEMATKSGFLVPKWYRIKSFTDLIKYSKILNHNDEVISFKCELQENLQKAMKEFVEEHPNWDQYRILQAAIAGFLMQKGFQNRDLTRLYIGNMFSMNFNN